MKYIGAHAFAAGYDFVTRDGYERTWEQFDAVIGFDKLRGMHLNDAKKLLNSRVDRHERIGQGHLGPAAFQAIMEDMRLNHIPMILKTPDTHRWAKEISWLKSMIPVTSGYVMGGL